MKIKFESGLEYQREAINAVVDIFNGQDTCNSNFTVYSPQYLEMQNALDLNAIGFANKFAITDEKLLENVQKIQLRNGLKPSTDKEVDKDLLDFSIEMETGTGKTYVYLRSIMEMNRQYGFTKFIIVVPSVAIRAGVMGTLAEFGLQLAQQCGLNHPIPAFEYDSSRLAGLKTFIDSPQAAIMVMNSQAFVGKGRVISDEENEAPLDGLTWLQALARCRPVVGALR